MSENNVTEKKEKNIKYNALYVFTFSVFILELVYFNSSNVELIDFIGAGNIIILAYSFGNKSWTKDHEDELATLFLMMMIIVIARCIIWGRGTI